MTDTPLHHDPLIAAFLADGGYDSVEDWARDSDYVEIEGEWCYTDPHNVAFTSVDLDECIAGAIEASGFQHPSQSAETN